MSSANFIGDYMVIFQNNVEKFHGAIKTGSAETVRSVLQNSSSPKLVINARNKVRTLPYGQQCQKTCLRLFANNKGADQPPPPRSLISAFVIRGLEVSYLDLL